MSRRRLRVLLLMHEHLVPPKSIKGMSEEEVHPFKMEWDVLVTLEKLGHKVHPLGVADDLAPIRRAIEEVQPDVCFNLLLTFHDVRAYDAYVASYLELLKAPFTGCNPRGLLLAGDKALSKKILSYHRVPVPGFRAFPRNRAFRVPKKLRFPLIVKSIAEHASVGISQASIVHDVESLAERVEYVHRTVGTGAIAEEYIRGRELTIGVLGNSRLTTFPVFELTFGNLAPSVEPIATARVKWDLDYQKKIDLKSGPAEDLPDGVAERIAKLAKRIYRILNMTGYGRIDLRLDPDGRLWVLEANPNPDLCYGEDFAAGAERIGIDYPALLQRILSLGARHTPPWLDRER